jgi:3-hydroxymyristoyl/3-hydroxydecanoyl-(acyl carrier protein) dehydratase
MLGINEIQEIIRIAILFCWSRSDSKSWRKARESLPIKNETMNEYFFQGHFPQEP